MNKTKNEHVDCGWRDIEKHQRIRVAIIESFAVAAVVSVLAYLFGRRQFQSEFP
jgi:hypothetical protein